MFKKHLVKQGRSIVGFVGMNNNQLFFAFGKPSQSNYMTFYCPSIEIGINKIKEYANIP